MIVKRIRQGVRQARGSLKRVLASVEALSRYVVDADPWAMVDLDRVRSLTDYALHVDARSIEPGEKVEAFGTFNLIGEDLDHWQMQMAAVAARCPRSRDPIEHFVYSWREGEHPTAAQVEEAGAILLEVLGYKNCPAIWSFHGNTAKDHGHLAVVRIDPATGTVAGDGWDIDRAHQAIALIEERQGWAGEPKALYVARGGEVYDRITGAKIRDRAGRQIGRRTLKALPPKIAAKAIEIREAAASATDWTHLHAKLAALKVAYRKKGSGAVVAVADQEVKASAIHPSCSRTHLEAALGAFEPDTSDRAQGYDAYREAYRLRLDHIRTVHADERARLKIWLEDTLSGLDVAVGTVFAIAVRAEYRAALQSLDSAFRDAKITFAAARLSPDQWAISGQPPAPAVFPLPTLMMPPARVVERPIEMPARHSETFRAQHQEWRTDYYATDGTKAFADLRCAIIVYSATPESFDAALRLAAARWRVVRVRASRANMLLVAERAEKLGIALIDIDGRPIVRRGKCSQPDLPSDRVGVEGKPAVPRSRSGIKGVGKGTVSNAGAYAPEPKPLASHIEDEIPTTVREAWLAFQKGLSR